MLLRIWVKIFKCVKKTTFNAFDKYLYNIDKYIFNKKCGFSNITNFTYKNLCTSVIFNYVINKIVFIMTGV